MCDAESSQQGQHRETTLNYVDLWLDHLDISEDHRVRGLARKLYDETEHRASAGSFAAGLTYLVTQCDSDYQHVSQREVAEISGFSRSTIQTHYQEIARQWNERDDDLVTDGGRAKSEKRTYRLAGWVFMILLGPIHFAGEMVGPTGATSWRQWACAITGSLLWGAAIAAVIHG